MRHQKGVWNGVWSYMYIETTFMRHGRGPRALMGITVKPKSVWSLSLHACAQVLKDLEGMRGRNVRRDQLVYNEELPGRIVISSDAVDRHKLKSVIHPLEIDQHPHAVINRSLTEVYRNW